VFLVADSAVVEALDHEPVVLEDAPTGGDRWVEVAVAAYQDDVGDVVLAGDGPDDWARMPIEEQEPTLAANGATIIGSDVALGEPPRTRVARPARVSRIRTTDDRIEFDVDRVGTPVLVKTSYFPNWKASGADGPWRVAPNLMVVVPTARHVSLHYGYTGVDVLGWVLTLLGLAGAVILARRPPVRYEDEDDEAALTAGAAVTTETGEQAGEPSPRQPDPVVTTPT
jgi:hypothetical protein